MKNLNEKTLEVLENTGLNWTVNKEPLFTQDGKATKSFGMYRNDNDMYLGTVGNQYQEFQNYEMAEILLRAVEGMDLDVTKGGSMKDGRMVYLQMPLKDKSIGSDTIKRHITCLNRHDGYGSLGFGSTNTVVSCTNSFHYAYRDAGMERIRHTSSMKERVERAVQGLRQAMGLDDGLMEKYDRLADVKLTDEIFAGVMKQIFDVDMDKKTNEYSTRKLNKMKQVSNVIESEIKQKGATLWGLFNGVTYYTNHVASKGEKEAYIMDGGGYATNLKTFKHLMNWIEKNSKPYEKVLIKK